MTNQEINALETRFKATTLLLFQCELMNIEEIDKGIMKTSKLFDDGYFDLAKKLLDLIDSIIVDILNE